MSSPTSRVIASLAGIILCGTVGALVGYGLLRLTGWGGPLGALIAVVVGTALATLLWIGLVVAFRRRRPPLA